MMKFSRRKMMQWAGGSALGGTLFGGLLGRRASAQGVRAVPFVDLALAGGGTGLWMLDQMGKIHTLGSAPPLFEQIGTTRKHSPFRAMVSLPGDFGVAALTMNGQIRTFTRDGKGFFFSDRDEVHILPCVDIARTSDGNGLWGIDLMGNLHAWGNATTKRMGSPPDPGRSPFVALVAAPNDHGLYALTKDGQLRTYGITEVEGNPPDPQMPVPFVDLAIMPRGGGLWALDMMGQILTLGRVAVEGSPPEPMVPSPYVAMVPTLNGDGLYALTMDGTIKTLGEAVDFTSLLP